MPPFSADKRCFRRLRHSSPSGSLPRPDLSRFSNLPGGGKWHSLARQSRCALLTCRALTEYVKFQRPVSSGYRCSCAPFACAPLYMACNPLYTTLHHYGYNYSRSDKKMQPLFFIFFCRKSKNFWVFRKCHKKRAKKVPGNSNSRSKTPERCRLVRVSKAVTVAIMESNMHCTDCPCEASPTRIGGACPSVNWQYSPFPFKNQVLFQIFKNLHKIYYSDFSQ